MSEQLYVKEVRSNISALSETALHHALVRMVRDTTTASTEFLRADRAFHTRSGGTEEHISDRVEEVADIVRGRLGVSEVDEANARPSHGLFRRSQYPLFVDGGTHTPIFSPAPSPSGHGRASMHIPGWGFFKSVRGQPAQEFMLKTYTEARALLRGDPAITDALREMNATAAAMRAEIEAT